MYLLYYTAINIVHKLAKAYKCTIKYGFKRDMLKVNVSMKNS